MQGTDHASFYCVFDTAVGGCAIVWAERGLIGVLLPEASDEATRARARRRYPGVAEAEPTEALVCWIGGCCDCSNVSTTGTQMCMSCTGAAAAADCGGDTWVPCPPGTCFMYGGKFAYKPGQTSTPGACK